MIKIGPEDVPFAEEFRRDPFGDHSPRLQEILMLFRGEPVEGKFVLVSTKPLQEWVIGKVSDDRSKPIEILTDHVFTRIEDAEWAVFKLRWKRYSGFDLEGTKDCHR